MKHKYCAFYINRMLPAKYEDGFTPAEDGDFTMWDTSGSATRRCRIHNNGKEVNDLDFVSPRKVKFSFELID